MKVPHPRMHPNPMVRHLLVAAGLFSVFLGLVGLLLPVVPTTPFLLVAGACFLRSSPRFYYWLIEHRWLGPYMRFYLSGEGIPRRAKVLILAALWLMIGTSAILLVPATWWWLSVTMVLVAAGVSVYIIRQPEPVAKRAPEGDERCE